MFFKRTFWQFIDEVTAPLLPSFIAGIQREIIWCENVVNFKTNFLI